MRERNIRISIREISRIEGHLDIDVMVNSDGEVEVHAKALEGTRIVENVLVGKVYWEAIEIASRMCGVCHAIHKLTATQAVENAFNVTPPSDAIKFREIIAIAGHIQSHLTHLFYFTILDYLGKENIFQMLRDKRDLVIRVINLRQLTDEVIKKLGGSSVHPITPIVGGLSREIKKSDILSAYEAFRNMLDLASDIVEEILNISIPDLDSKSLYAALTNRNDIPLLQGKIRIGEEYHDAESFIRDLNAINEPYSNATHFIYRSSSYMVGALARLNLNHKNLVPEAKELCKRYNLEFPNYNPFANNLAQAIEIIHYIHKGLSILDDLKQKNNYQNRIRFTIRKGNGVSVSEAPRGLLFHQYELNENGIVTKANIITPTAQNLKNLEETIAKYFNKIRNLPPKDIEKEIMKLVRSYDPCISCAARFRKISN